MENVSEQKNIKGIYYDKNKNCYIVIAKALNRCARVSRKNISFEQAVELQKKLKQSILDNPAKFKSLDVFMETQRLASRKYYLRQKRKKAKAKEQREQKEQKEQKEQVSLKTFEGFSKPQISLEPPKSTDYKVPFIVAIVLLAIIILGLGYVYITMG